MAAGLWEERGKSPGLPQSFPTFRACFEYILQTLYAFFFVIIFFWQDRPGSEGRRHADLRIKLSPGRLKKKYWCDNGLIIDMILPDKRPVNCGSKSTFCDNELIMN